MSPELTSSSSSVAPYACCAASKLPEHSFGFPLSLQSLPPTLPYVCSQWTLIGFGPDSAPIGTGAVQYAPSASLAAVASTPLIVMKAFLPGSVVLAPDCHLTYALTIAVQLPTAKYGSGSQLLAPGGMETLPSSGGPLTVTLDRSWW